MQNLEQILAVLQQDVSMKDVFAELDGFVAVVNALSTLNSADSSPTLEGAHDTATISAIAVSFEIMIVSMTFHTRNVTVFEVHTPKMPHSRLNHL